MWNFVLGSTMKHALHCVLFITLWLVFESVAGGLRFWELPHETMGSIEKYGLLPSIFLYFLRFVTFLNLPQCVFNCLGLLFFNAFPEKVQLKGSPRLAPFVCIRTVTRGDYPDLVKNNAIRNMNTCLDIGLKNFLIEVVTDKTLNMPKHPRIKETVVPSTYRTKSGALFKARSLQYCLEDVVNVLCDSDWIVHLDEETIITENSLKGIVNFIFDGKYQFGQGLITYANEGVVNWLTTLADSFRVADDIGKLQFQLKIFHRPLFGWKGSYMVAQAGAERKVSFDHGLDGSIAEDSFFSMVAYNEGYIFNFIEGEMWEKSPFTLWDFMQQRKRWLQGISLIVHSAAIPFRNKVFLSCAFYFWVTIPLSTSNIILALIYPLPCWQFIDFTGAFVAAVVFYMYIFGVIKSFSFYQLGPIKFCLCVIGVLCTIPINIILENVAVIWACFGKKYEFYVVNKEV